ncbi:hypothetical protein B0H14DRAFT_2586435 [Mycena olivaceomarginata]|nr:hypothetical protein B0H14DRAFT_2586435 [Mycena olivaceomarginata]
MEGRRWNRRVGWQIRAARNGGAKLDLGRDKIGAGARKSLREERRTRLSSRVIGRERWCATDQKRKQTRVTLSGCGGQRNASSMGEVVHAKEKEDQSREQTTGFRVARPEVLAPYTAAPGNAERRLGDRNAESAL